jgi:hypothetical protein
VPPLIVLPVVEKTNAKAAWLQRDREDIAAALASLQH